MKYKECSPVTGSLKKITVVINSPLSLDKRMEKLIEYNDVSGIWNDQIKTFDELHCFMDNVTATSDEIRAKAIAAEVRLYDLQNKKRKHNDI